MDNIILANLSAENFSSFADEIKFTTVVDSGKKEYIRGPETCAS